MHVRPGGLAVAALAASKTGTCFYSERVLIMSGTPISMRAFTGLTAETQKLIDS